MDAADHERLVRRVGVACLDGDDWASVDGVAERDRSKNGGDAASSGVGSAGVRGREESDRADGDEAASCVRCSHGTE
jgi:hypothetical protein